MFCECKKHRVGSCLAGKLPLNVTANITNIQENRRFLSNYFSGVFWSFDQHRWRFTSCSPHSRVIFLCFCRAFPTVLRRVLECNEGYDLRNVIIVGFPWIDPLMGRDDIKDAENQILFAFDRYLSTLRVCEDDEQWGKGMQKRDCFRKFRGFQIEKKIGTLWQVHSKSGTLLARVVEGTEYERSKKRKYFEQVVDRLYLNGCLN